MAFLRVTLVSILIVFAFDVVIQAAALTRVSDRVSTSAPSAAATHMIEFTTTQAIPASGRILITFQTGAFTVPAGFDFQDVDLAVSSGGPYVERTLAASASATEDGVAVITGTSGSITITLGSAGSIAAGERVRILLGTNAVTGATGDDSISNPSATGSYGVTVATQTASSVALDSAKTLVAIVAPITTTSENLNIPPGRSNGLPSGEIAAGNTTVEISLETNELATCRFATTPGVSYSSMTGTFTSVGGTLFHANVTGHQNETEYTYYVRCKDIYETFNTDDYEITFSLAETPISNTSIVVVSQGNGGVGTFPDGSSVLYLSSVVFSGTASPESSIVIVKDGKQHTTLRTGSDGAFSGTITGLERGTYTFLLYAVDGGERKSGTFSSTISLAQGTTNSIKGVIVPPTMQVASSAEEAGGDVVLTGASVPGATIEVLVSRTSGADRKRYTTKAAAEGAWTLTIPSLDVTRGTYEIRARAFVDDAASDSTIATVGVSETPSDGTARVDVNGDDKINLVDFSILLSFWGTSETSVDLNADGTVNLADFSIMLFNWTG